MTRPDATWHIDSLTPVIEIQDGTTVRVHEIGALGSRMAAHLFDTLILAPWAFGALLVAGQTDTFTFEKQGLIVLGTLLLARMAYSLFFEVVTRGETPGKNACGLLVVSSDGSRAGLFQLLVRNLLRLIDFLPLGYGIGGYRALRAPSAQRIGDSVAGTVVVRTLPLKEQLELIGVPASVYSTSEDGYLLEAFVNRSPGLDAETSQPLARHAANYFARKYPPDGPLAAEFNQGHYWKYLTALYLQEQQALETQTTETPSDSEAGSDTD